ncbi:ArsR/SmtB family transcription factor [Marinibaculum pumilum]|uniref:ArsR/SmtB family transcription factor n=1 Tax=Marinibaculum pumilum TaxID=1766165 RepID=A0ABV7KTS4_9PROT
MDETDALDALAALSQESRLRLFRLLVTCGPDGLPAGEIARRMDVPHNTLSSQLGQLSRAGLTRARREGRSVIYAPDFDGIRALLGFLMKDCCGGPAEQCNALLDRFLRPDCTTHCQPACGDRS